MNGGNLLFWNKNVNYAENIYELLRLTVERGKTVLLLTRTPSPSELFFPSLINKISFPKELLKNLVVMTCPTIEDIIRKLLELHDWMILPSLLILDLVPFIATSSEQYQRIHSDILNDGQTRPLLQSVCFCIASLFNYTDSLRRKLIKLNVTAENEIHRSYSVLVLQEHAENLTRTQLELIVNLYYNTHNACDDFADLKSAILQQS